MREPYYDAEDALTFILNAGGTYEAFGSKLTIPVHRKFGDLDGIRRYVDKVCDWLELGDPPTIRHKQGERTAKYYYGERAIGFPALSTWAYDELTVLHELAHHISPVGHGPVWAGKFVWLVEKCIGPEAGFILMANFSERDVQIATVAI